jgi:hypothetical protein
MRALRILALGGVAFVLMTAGALAQTKSRLTAAELEAVLTNAGLRPTMTEDAKSGAPVAQGRAGEFIFWVRALNCSGLPKACEDLMFFANFNLERDVAPNDFQTINAFNDAQVFGRAYLIEAEKQVGVDYVIELGGGVTQEHVTKNVARWIDIIAAFVDRFNSAQSTS